MKKKINILFFLLALSISTCGCGTLLDSVRLSIEEHGKGVFIDNVPEVAEQGGGWAAAALEAVYRFHGREISQKTISRRIYDHRTGRATLGLIARDVEMNDMEAIRTSAAGAVFFLRMGFPVLVPAQAGAAGRTAPPWMILAGYDDVTKVVICRAGKELVVIPQDEFSDIAKMNGGGLMVVAPPGKMPVAVYSDEARAAEHRGDWLEAIRILRMALEREASEPEKASFYIRISRMHFALDNNAAAIESANAALEIQPGEGDNWHELALAIYREHGNVSEVRPMLESAVETSPEKSSYYYAELGRMYFEAGNIPAARAVYENAVRAEVPEGAPDDYEAKLYIRLAEVVEAQGYPQLGRDYREKALRK